MSRLRLLQVSDLHFGETDAHGLPYAPAPYLYPPLNGWLGHDPVAARKVARFARDLRRDGVPLLVVTTGDLTARGHPDQFAKAAGYLGSTVRDGPTRVGLRDPGWLDRAIPGNHDHWKGDLGFGTVWAFPHMLLPPTAAFHGLFDCLPATGTPPLSVDGIPPIRFVRLDTDADVPPFSFDRFAARGSFSSHVEWLEANLPKKEPGEIRVVLAHHCREHRGRWFKGRGIEMDAPSREDFDNLLVQHEVDVLLSGHTHDVAVSKAEVTGSSGSRTVLYARCGTSTGVNPRDPRFRNLSDYVPLDAYPRRAERSVVVHDVHCEGGDTRWTASAYVLDRDNRFVAAPAHEAVSDL